MDMKIIVSCNSPQLLFYWFHRKIIIKNTRMALNRAHTSTQAQQDFIFGICIKLYPVE